MICKKNYSFIRVIFFSVFFPEIFQVNGGGRAVKTKISQAVFPAVQVRISLGSFISVILLTFVGHSNGFHGTVGRTTGFWCARYGFESPQSPFFYTSIVGFGLFCDCFFLFLAKLIYSAVFGALWIKKLTFFRHFGLSIIFLFKIATNFLLFSLFSSVYFFEAPNGRLCKALASPRKHPNVPSTNFFSFVRRKIVTPHSLHNFFSIAEFCRNTEWFPMKCFGTMRRKNCRRLWHPRWA